MVGIAAYDLDNNIMLAKSIKMATTRNFDSSIRNDTRKKTSLVICLISAKNQTKPVIDNIVLLFKSDIPEQKHFTLMRIYQQLQISEAGLHFCDGSNFANND